LTPEAVVERVTERDRQIVLSRQGEQYLNEKMSEGTLDSAAFNEVGNGLSRGAAMKKLGMRWRESVKGPGSRVAGIQQIHRLFKPGRDGKPMLQVFASCREFINIFPILPRDPHNPEDIDPHSEGHFADAARYALGHLSRRTFGRARPTGL
jgi:hypothetical protein